METGKICIRENCFEIEIASSIIEKSKGLSGRKSLNKKIGMLFIFRFNARHAFWMKNTLIPLDIIWLDRNLKIVDIKANCEPCKTFFCRSIIPQKSAKYVLEINGGLCKELGIKVGSEAKIINPSEPE